MPEGSCPCEVPGSITRANFEEGDMTSTVPRGPSEGILAAMLNLTEAHCCDHLHPPAGIEFDGQSTQGWTQPDLYTRLYLLYSLPSMTGSIWGFQLVSAKVYSNIIYKDFTIPEGKHSIQISWHLPILYVSLRRVVAPR